MSFITILIIVFILFLLFFLFLLIVSFSSNKNQDQEKGEEEYERLRKEAYGEDAYNEEKKFESQVKINMNAVELEKKGKIEEAIKLYEQVIKNNFIGNGPYDRLAIIYRRKKQYDEEIRVLEKAIWVFKNVVSDVRPDKEPKLKNFQERLNKAILLKEKEGEK